MRSWIVKEGVSLMSLAESKIEVRLLKYPQRHADSIPLVEHEWLRVSGWRRS
jgi:hypothetical protein